MRPMMRRKSVIARLASTYGWAMRLRVSLDDYRPEIHDRGRGRGSFAKAMEGLVWLASLGVVVEVAARFLSGDSEEQLRGGFARTPRQAGIPIDCSDPQQLVLFPEMREEADPPEITPACWRMRNVSPDGIMCSNARMVVKRKDAHRPTVLACTLIADDERFELGATLADANKPVHLAHRHCATVCVLGGAACGTVRKHTFHPRHQNGACLSGRPHPPRAGR